VEGCRLATLADVPRLAELAEQAVAELRQLRGGEVWARREARRPPWAPPLEAQVEAPSSRVVAGTIDDVIVAYAVADLDRGPHGGDDPLCVVTDLYVEPGARGVGIGEVMMDDLVAWATEAGCYGVDSVALPGDRATKNFFESFGLVARAITVHRRLPAKGELP
jgi:GNAT superfamily N-acetyltransferase